MKNNWKRTQLSEFKKYVKELKEKGFNSTHTYQFFCNQWTQYWNRIGAEEAKEIIKNIYGKDYIELTFSQKSSILNV